MTRGNDVGARWEYTDGDEDTMEVLHRELNGEVDFITYMHDATPGEGVSGFVSIPGRCVPGLIEFLNGIVPPADPTAPADVEPVSPVQVQAVDVEDVGTGITVEFFVVSVGFHSEPITTRSVATLARDKMIKDGSAARIIRRTVIDEDVT